MKTIFRYTLQVDDRVTMEMPENADILTAQDRNGMISIWAGIDTNAPKVQRHFAILGTGNPIEGETLALLVNQKLSFIATVQLRGLVWHLFEILQ